MKNKLLYAGLVSASLLSAAVTASHAAPIVMSDNDLDMISGKASNFITAGVNDVRVAMIGNDHNNNIQWGVYQWSDDHSFDTSQAKGGNQFDGNQSAIQASVVANNNALFWGALGQTTLNSTGIGSGATVSAHATMSVGGF